VPENTVTVSQLVSMLRQYQESHPEVQGAQGPQAAVATGNNPGPRHPGPGGTAGREQVAPGRGDARAGGGVVAAPAPGPGPASDALGRAVDLALLKPRLEREVDAAIAIRMEAARFAGKKAAARDAELAAQSQQCRFVTTGRPGATGPSPAEVSGAPVSTTQLERLRQGGCVPAHSAACVLPPSPTAPTPDSDPFSSAARCGAPPPLWTSPPGSRPP
jgi:hypothetical protein